MKIIMPPNELLREQNDLYRCIIAALGGEFNVKYTMLTDRHLTRWQKRRRIKNSIKGIKKRWNEIEQTKKDLGCNSCFWTFKSAYGSAKQVLKKRRQL